MGDMSRPCHSPLRPPPDEAAASCQAMPGQSSARQGCNASAVLIQGDSWGIWVFTDGSPACSTEQILPSAETPRRPCNLRPPTQSHPRMSSSFLCHRQNQPLELS